MKKQRPNLSEVQQTFEALAEMERLGLVRRADILRDGQIAFTITELGRQVFARGPADEDG